MSLKAHSYLWKQQLQFKVTRSNLQTSHGLSHQMELLTCYIDGLVSRLHHEDANKT